MTLDLVVQPIQILVGIALLIYTLGYSALVGLAVSHPSTPPLNLRVDRSLPLLVQYKVWSIYQMVRTSLNQLSVHVCANGQISTSSTRSCRRSSQTPVRDHRKYPRSQIVRVRYSFSRGTRMHHRLGRLFNSDRDRGNPSLMVMHDI